MRQLKVLALLIGATIFLYGCPKHDDWHKEIAFINNSDKDIVFYHDIGTPDAGESIKWYCPAESSTHYELPGVNAGSTIPIHEGRRFHGYEGIMGAGQVLTIIVGDMATWQQYRSEPCEVIRENVPILHRYELTLADLNRMNWTVVYPPEE